MVRNIRCPTGISPSVQKKAPSRMRQRKECSSQFMNWLLHSFRWRILLGAFFWTLGLIPVGHLIFLTIHHQTHAFGRVVILPVEPVSSLTFAFLCMLAG